MIARAALVALAAAGCLPDRPIARLDDDCREQLAAVVYDHACQHGRLGPYLATQAAAVPALAPIVDGAQRVLEIALPSAGVARPAYLRYAATRGGRHAVFAGADHREVAIGLADADGRPLAPTLIEPPGAAGCGGMVAVTGFELDAGATYLVVLGPTRAPSARLFAEHLPTFDEDWSDRCFD